VRVIALKELREFWPSHPDAEEPLRAWFKEAENADWKTPAELKARYANASILKDNRVCFNIGGNKYRLVTLVFYRVKMVYIRFIGTHEEYDKIDANTV
jgi:mRNA interferase HigB